MHHWFGKVRLFKRAGKKNLKGKEDFGSAQEQGSFVWTAGIFPRDSSDGRETQHAINCPEPLPVVKAFWITLSIAGLALSQCICRWVSESTAA